MVEVGIPGRMHLPKTSTIDSCLTPYLILQDHPKKLTREAAKQPAIRLAVTLGNYNLIQRGGHAEDLAPPWYPKSSFFFFFSPFSFPP